MTTLPPLMAPPPSPPPYPSDFAWYGNIQYLLNISAVGAAVCVLLFLLVKLRSDHRRIPGPAALLAKLLAVHHATAAQIALHCGADASQFLHTERGSFFILLSVSLVAILAVLPLNLYAGSASVGDRFSETTINHLSRGSLILWVHFLLMIVILGLAQMGISKIEDNLRIGRDSHQDSSMARFTLMVHGVPKFLAADKSTLEEYFSHRYPGKLFRIVVPFNLSALEGLIARWAHVQEAISKLEARISQSSEVIGDDRGRNQSFWFAWAAISGKFGFTDEKRLRKLRNSLVDLRGRLLDYEEGKAEGAGIAFVIFKDVYTANQAVRDFRSERKNRPIGQFFPLMELQLERSRWRVKRAPPAADIYWNNLGSSKLFVRLRRVAVNSCLLLMLLFFSSPLALINAMKSAAQIINAEALDHAQVWFTWFEGSTWFGSVVLQFLPNVLIFISMYILIPSTLSYLSKFEKHLTVSGEQRAALVKMVCFFLVNIILLRAMVESSLEGWILQMGKCYVDGGDCKRIEEYMSPSFLTRSCLSALAFLITSTFLGISFDLLAPVPWIKKALKKFRKNDMLLLVPEQSEEYPLGLSQGEDQIRMPLIPEREGVSALNGVEWPGRDLSVYPINRSFHMPKQKFDFAQYYAFNLTIFALTMIYSLFAPLVVPVGAAYFGYRYLVDKYNFLFVYRVRGFPSGNDGKLMGRVLCVMHFCVVMFLVSMLLFFSIQGDSTKLQAIFTLGLLIFYKLIPLRADVFEPSVLEGSLGADSLIDGPTDYEVLSQPTLDWNAYHV